MVTFGDLRRWRSEPLDDAVGALRSRCDEMVGLSDELTASVPAWWAGIAAAGAQRARDALADRMEHLVAAVAAVRSGLGGAVDAVAQIRRAVEDLDNSARVSQFAIADDGTVVDRAPASGPADLERARYRDRLAGQVALVVRRADQLDEFLAGLFGRASRGEIGDGGATSLDEARAHGDEEGNPEIPGPPDNPPTDPGAGGHGSDPWWTRGDDVLAREAAAVAADIAEGIGWTNAAAHLRHYLDNSGEDYRVSPDEIGRDAPGFQSAADQTTAEQIRQIAAEAESTGRYGQPVQFSSGWQGYYIGPEQSEDWYYAMGGVQYAVTGVATVHPPEQPGGEPRVEVEYQTHVHDRYNWDAGKQTQIGPFTVTDEQMAEMHRAGVAQEFNMSGSSDVRQWSGAVPPPGQQPDLPQPPDNRDGTRSDPGRDRG